jgi:hypothetical protein
MRTLRIYSIIFLVILLFGSSCKKDEDKPTGPVYVEPAIAERGEVVAIPDGLESKANAGDYDALIAVSYMNLANAISAYSSAFTIPDNAEETGKKSGSKVYHWSYQGYSYWMTFEELASSYRWKYEWEFPGQSRFTYFLAEELKSGASGSWTIYNPENPTNEVWNYDWSVSSNETFSATLEWNDGDESSSFEVEAKADNSGSFMYYTGTTLNAEILWNSNGSGTYTFYEEGGNITGSWTSTK